MNKIELVIVYVWVTKALPHEGQNCYIWLFVLRGNKVSTPMLIEC